MDNDQLLAEIRRRIANGEITADSIMEFAPPPAKKRGRPRKPPVPKKANGRPLKIERRKIVFAVWLLFHDRLPKQELKALLADCFDVDISIIEKHVAEINRISRDPRWFIGRNVECGMVLAIPQKKLRKLMMRGRRCQASGMLFDPAEELESYILQKPPEK